MIVSPLIEAAGVGLKDLLDAGHAQMLRRLVQGGDEVNLEGSSLVPKTSLGGASRPCLAEQEEVELRGRKQVDEAMPSGRPQPGLVGVFHRGLAGFCLQAVG
jgi:hypothetical protein